MNNKNFNIDICLGLNIINSATNNIPDINVLILGPFPVEIDNKTIEFGLIFNDPFHSLHPSCCFTSTINSYGHVRTVN